MNKYARPEMGQLLEMDDSNDVADWGRENEENGYWKMENEKRVRDSRGTAGGAISEHALQSRIDMTDSMCRNDRIGEGGCDYCDYCDLRSHDLLPLLSAHDDEASYFHAEEAEREIGGGY